MKSDLRRKARLVAGGNHTQTPPEDVYSSVVAMDTVRLTFQVAALNGLQVCAANIGNAYRYGLTRAKVFVRAGPKFKEREGMPLIIHKGLYGLRSSGARSHVHLSNNLQTMGYKPCYFDSDLWIKDCGTHYEYTTT